MRRRLIGWLSVVATALSVGAVAAVPPATAATGDVAVIGEKVSTGYNYKWFYNAAPTAGAPTTQVDAAAGRVTVAVEDANGPASLTFAWPLRVGAWEPAVSGSEPEQLVTMTRGNSSCTFTTGTLTVRRAESTSTGAVAALDVDLSGMCFLNSGSSYERFGAAVRIGVDGANPVAVPRAQPARLRGAALAGATVHQEVTVTNAGTKPWVVGGATVGSARSSSPSFQVDAAASTCLGATLQPGDMCTMAVAAVAPAWDLWEHLIVNGDSPTSLVVPIYLEGHNPIPPPTHVALTPGRLSSTVTWAAPAKQPSSGYRIYDITGGKRALLTSAPASATEARVAFHGPGRLALVAATGSYAESEDVFLDVPAITSEVVADDWYGWSVAFPADVSAGVARTTGFERGSLDPAESRWVTPRFSDGSTDTLGICPASTEVCTALPGLTSPTAALIPYEAVWLPNGTIAFTRSWDGATRTLWVVGADGSGLRKVANVPDGDQLATAPSGTEVLLRLPLWSTSAIQRVRLSDGAISTVPGTSDMDSFTVSTQGLLVVERRVDRTAWEGARTTTVMNLDGSGARKLALPSGDNRGVTFDPTGTRVAFSRYAGPYDATVWVAAADGSGGRQLSTRSAGWINLSWSADNAAGPRATVTGPAFTTSTATLSVGATDADDAVGSLRRECRLDGAAAWTACGPTWTLKGLAGGKHTAYVRAKDPSGRLSAVASRTWTVDTSAPTASVVAPSVVQTTSPMTLTWSAADSGGSGLVSYDVRRRYAAPYGGFGSYASPSGWERLTTKSLRVPLSAGYQYCFSVRARDGVGNVGPWSAEKCTSMTLDDRSLSASAGWTRGTSSAYAFGTWSRATRTGATLSRSSIKGRQIGILVTTCSTCGVVDVYHAGVRLGRVSLYSATTHTRQVRWLPLQSTTRSGTVTIKTVNSRAVIMDGLVIRH